MIESITVLTKEWQALVCADHYKDRDLHWTIETRWSYGKEPVYIIYHYGYVAEKIEEPCASYEDALERLARILRVAIETEKKWRDENE